MYSLIETSARIPASILKNDCLHCNGTSAGTISMIWCPKCSIYGSALPSHPLFGEAKRPVAKMIDFTRKSPVPVRIRKKSPCLFIALISQETISLHRYMRLPCEGHPEQKQPVHSPGNNSRFLFLVRYRSHEKTPLFFSDRTV